jgi:RNA polymerase sigma-70 factor (ECF subfamily)
LALGFVSRGVTFDVAVPVPAESAYDRVFEAHWNDVFRFALAWTNDWGAAEDVAQETFVRLWRRRGLVDLERDPRPWLFTTARRLATDRFRQLRRRLLGSPPPAALDEATTARWLDVRRGLAGLSPLERSALLLTTAQGRGSLEAAQLLATTPGAVRAAVSRARAKLEDVR